MIEDDRVRHGIFAGALLLAACHPTASMPDPPDPTPKSSETRSNAPRFVDTLELSALIEQLPTTSLIGRGWTTAANGVVALNLGAATVSRVSGEGDPCSLDDAAPVLIVFEGPEAFALLGAGPPRIVAAERGSARMRCWSASSRPEWREHATREGALRLSVYNDDSPETPLATAHARTTGELVPASAGTETLELDLRGDELTMRVTSHAGAELLNWVGDDRCEGHWASVAVVRLESGVLVLLDQSCDECPSCDHAESGSKSHEAIWWPDGEQAWVVARSSLEQHSRDFGLGYGGQTDVLHSSRESWRLDEGVLHHDTLETTTTTVEEECSDLDSADDCCMRSNTDEVIEDWWTFEPDTGDVFTGVVEHREASEVDFDECQ